MDVQTSQESTESPADVELFRQLDAYDWDDDKEFQYALKAILGSNSSPAQVNDLTIRAKCYYFSRKKQISVDFNSYKSWVAAHAPDDALSPSASEQPAEAALHAHHEQDLPPATAADSERTAMYPATFAQIVEMITSGKPIPGIKDIPPTVLTGQATKPAASKRRKPWEKDNIDPAGGGGTFGDRRDDYIPQELPEE